MGKEKPKIKKVAKKFRTANLEELYQDCPKCDEELLVKFQSEKGLDYKCQSCGHEEFRKWK